MADSGKNAHTPGPWGIVGKKGQQEIVRLVNGGPVGFMVYGGVKDDEATANAQLISAAPELLEALKDVVRWWEQLAQEQYERTVLHQTLESAAENWLKPSEVSPFSLDQLKAAIAKAEGR